TSKTMAKVQSTPSAPRKDQRSKHDAIDSRAISSKRGADVTASSRMEEAPRASAEYVHRQYRQQNADQQNQGDRRCERIVVGLNALLIDVERHEDVLAAADESVDHERAGGGSKYEH